MSRFQKICPENRDKTTGTGLAHACRDFGTCPVPNPVPTRPVPCPDLIAMLKAAAERANSAWQRGFVAGVQRRADSGTGLTPKQLAVLGRIGAQQVVA